MNATKPEMNIVLAPMWDELAEAYKVLGLTPLDEYIQQKLSR